MSPDVGSAQMTMKLSKGSYQKLNDSDTGAVTGCILISRLNKKGVTKRNIGGMAVLELVQANPVKNFLFCL